MYWEEKENKDSKIQIYNEKKKENHSKRGTPKTGSKKVVETYNPFDHKKLSHFFGEFFTLFEKSMFDHKNLNSTSQIIFEYRQNPCSLFLNPI